MSRGNVVRRSCAVLVLLVATLLIAAGPASAAASDENPEQIKATLTRSTIQNANPNNITMDITIVNTGTKKPPHARYGVFLNAQQGDDEPILINPENCTQTADFDPTVTPGVYRCSIIINNPGSWTFTATVNLPTATGQQLIRTLNTTLDITDAVVLSGEYKGVQYAVTGKSFEVFLLQIHVIFASIWLLLVGALSFIAVPRLRRSISTLALQTLEVRRSFLNSSMWVAFGSTLITGTWLLTTQTAYKAPFSANKFSFTAYSDVTRLPYASMYFNALYLKILLFFVMGAASTVLAMEAGRQAQAAQDAGTGEDDEIDMWSTGVHFDEFGHVLHDDRPRAAVAEATTVAAPAPAHSGGVGSRLLWACVAVMVGGTGVIGLCVTILKYCHELIETANAARILGG
jgi:hypothetical protein